MPRAIPPLDQVARALAALGRAHEAIALLELSVARGGEERARGEGLLAHLRARPDERPGSPGIRVDAELVEGIATHGRLAEARIVAHSVDIGGSVLGLELCQALDLVLAPLPAGEDAGLALIYAEALAGSAMAVQRLLLSPGASPELRTRAQTLVQLLRGFRAQRPSAEAASGMAVDPAVHRVVAELMQRRDLAWGMAELGRLTGLAGAAELHADVSLLLAASERAAAEEGQGVAATAPLEGPGVALLYVRMFNLEQAERALRRVCLERPGDREAPVLLAAVARLRSVQDASIDDARDPAAPKAAPPEWLNKRSRKASVEGWASTQRRAPTPAPYEDAATSVLRPDDEAELHLRAGNPDKAIEIYLRLAERFPDRVRFRERAAEIQAVVSAKEIVFADEMTVRRDLRPLAAASEHPPGAPPTLVQAASDPSTVEMPIDEGPPLPEETTETSVVTVSVRPIIGVG
jgi:tetratricopeptide (TPR) repeat protein